MIPLRDSTPSRHFPLVTLSLIVANGLVFLHMLGLSSRELEALFHLHGMVPARILHPEAVARVGLPPQGYEAMFSSMFLHGGWLHLISNMWILWIFGDNVEDRMGSFRFAVFYVLCGLLAAAAHLATNAASLVPTVGASGAIAGVMGAYFILFPRATVLTLVPILFIPLLFEVPAVFFLAFWFWMQLVSGAASLGGSSQDTGGIAWWAHIGGFLVGMFAHRWFLRRDRALAAYKRPR